MKRREFSLAGATALASTVIALPAHAQKQPVEGKDYLDLSNPVAVEVPKGKIEVIEFFWYSCPHCNAFEPKLEAWIKKAPADVVIRRVPVAFRDSFVPQQRLFYTLEAMGKLDEMHGKVFTTIHAERKPLDREDQILAWVGANGLDAAKFKELYNSFAISTKARKATQAQDAFKVQGVPALGIAGRYYTDGTTAGTMDRALQVTDYLIAEARKAR
jgi:thiol:disulfide interchange protein DsbA